MLFKLRICGPIQKFKIKKERRITTDRIASQTSLHLNNTTVHAHIMPLCRAPSPLIMLVIHHWYAPTELLFRCRWISFTLAESPFYMRGNLFWSNFRSLFSCADFHFNNLYNRLCSDFVGAHFTFSYAPRVAIDRYHEHIRMEIITPLDAQQTTFRMEIHIG